MKPKKLARHAKNRMRMHGITETEIDLAVENPDFTEPSAEGRINVWKKLGDKFLRVTYKNEPARILVITAVKKKKGWR
jgi:hypothetical protein